MNELEVKIINKSIYPLPVYETILSAGMDLRANLSDGPIILKPLQRVVIPTGLFIELPERYEAQIRPRSGLAVKTGVTVLNTPGTIDADYRGALNKLGQIDLTFDHRYDIYVINSYTQYNYGREVIQLDYEALTLCLRKINFILRGRRVGLPY